jgi:hypothetical protein
MKADYTRRCSLVGARSQLMEVNHKSQSRRKPCAVSLSAEFRGSTHTPLLFRQLTDAIAHAYLLGDEHTVDLLLAAKQSAVDRHYQLPAERR